MVGFEERVRYRVTYFVSVAMKKGRPKKTWREIVEKDCKASGLNREDAMDRSRWRKQIGMIDDKIHRAVKRLCVCAMKKYLQGII